MTMTLHFDSVFLCFTLVIGVGAMFAVKHWKR